MRYLVLTCFSLVALAQPSFTGGNPSGFRNATWGMTQQQVLAAESAKPSGISTAEGEVIVRYASLDFANLPAHVVYIFAADKLVRAKYVFDAEHAELNDFIQDYQTLATLMRNTLGKPEKGEALWLDDSTQEERIGYLIQDRATPDSILPSDRGVGLAVSLGHLKIYAQWTTPHTTIVHSLIGENHRITHQVEYRSVELETLEERVRTTALH